MAGLENILNKIIEDANKKADEIIKKAEENNKIFSTVQEYNIKN